MKRESDSPMNSELTEEFVVLQTQMAESKSLSDSQGNLTILSHEKTTFTVTSDNFSGNHEMFRRESFTPLSVTTNQREEIWFHPEGDPSKQDVLNVTFSKSPGFHSAIYITQDGRVERLVIAPYNHITTYERMSDGYYSLVETDKLTDTTSDPRLMHIDEIPYLDIPGIDMGLQKQLLSKTLDLQATKTALNSSYTHPTNKPLIHSLIFA